MANSDSEITGTGLVSNTALTAITSTSNTSNNTATLSAMTNSPALTPDSPEWKWQWGDLPTRSGSWSEMGEVSFESPSNKDTAAESAAVTVDSGNATDTAIPILPSTTTSTTIELFAYLSQSDYLRGRFKVLSRFPGRSMICRVFEVDRGAVFLPCPTATHLELTQVLMESSAHKLQEWSFNQFVSDPRVLADEPYRLLFQFSWQNEQVWLGGVVGVVVAVGAAIWGRILDDEEGFIRLGQQLHLKAGDSEVAEIVETTEPVPVPALPQAIPTSSSSTVTAALNEPQLNSVKSSSSWKSWWSRSGTEKKNSNSNGNGKIDNNVSSTSISNSTTTTATTLQTTSLSTGSNSLASSSATTFLSAQSSSQSSLPISVALHSPPPSTPHVIHRTSSPNPSISSLETATPTQYIKSLRLPSHLLKQLNLRLGVNTITYTVNTRLQGTATCQSRIFLWRSDARVVISDIDGTITKSDALGHLFTMVGKDWTHVGVASLYSKIAKNGYEFLYLTSRAIGQAASTRGYLKGVEQDRFQLPDGPVIMSPDRLFTALHREVIQRRPDEFKIACLRDIQRLFVADEESVACMGSGVISSSEDESTKPSSSFDSYYTSTMPSIRTSSTKPLIPKLNIQQSTSTKNPFYAGFGNRPTDTKSYKAVGIPTSRIFLIDSMGDLKLDRLTFFTPYSASSYAKLTEEVDKVFPPLLSPQALVREAGDEAFTDFQYWSAGNGDICMELVTQLLSGGGKVTKTKDTVKTKESVKMDASMKQEIVQLPVGEGLVALTEEAQVSMAVAAVADSRIIISSPGRRRSESVNRITGQGKRLSLMVSEEGDADVEYTDDEEDDDDEEEDEGTSVTSITSYPFM